MYQQHQHQLLFTAAMTGGRNGASSSSSNDNTVDAAPSPSPFTGHIGNINGHVGDAYDPAILAQIAAAAANMGLPFIPATGFVSPLSALSSGFGSPQATGSSSSSVASSLMSPGGNMAAVPPASSSLMSMEQMIFSPNSMMGNNNATSLLPNVDLSQHLSLISPLGGVPSDMHGAPYMRSFNPSSSSSAAPLSSIGGGAGHNGGNSGGGGHSHDHMALPPSLNDDTSLLVGSSTNSVSDIGDTRTSPAPMTMDHSSIDYLLPSHHHASGNHNGTMFGTNDAPL